MYSLIHKLGCVARQAAAEGVIDTTGNAAGGAVGPSVKATAAAAGPSASGAEGAAAAAALERCLPLLVTLKHEAERLVLEDAKQPRDVHAAVRHA